MTDPVYLLHGLRLRSEIALEAPLAPGGDGGAVHVVWGRTGPVGAVRPAGEVVGESVVGRRRMCTITACPRGYLVRFHRLCDVWVPAGLDRMILHRDPAADPALVGMLVTGAMTAFLLTMRGTPVLHASAVEREGRALAFVAGSGEGKSTLAALCCRAGARLVSDDTLALDLDADGAWCRPGGGWLRLRPTAEPLAAGLPALTTSRTADGRLAVALEGPRDPVRLVAILLPAASPGASRPRLERLEARQATEELLRHARAGQLRAPAAAGAWLRSCAKLARSIPVLRAEIPWRQPFPLELAAALFEEAQAAIPVAEGAGAGSGAAV